MAIIKCKECNKDVSDTANVCPHCGVKRPAKLTLAEQDQKKREGMTPEEIVKLDKMNRGGCLIVSLLAFVVIVILANVSGDDESTSAYKKLGDKWPLTVKEGTVGCEYSGDHRGERFGAAYFEHKGAKYALNGLAGSRGYRPIEKLSLGRSISPLLALALKEC